MTPRATVVTTAALACAALSLAACGGGGKKDTSTTTAKPGPSTTATTGVSAPVQPLLGVPGTPTDRPALIVKIDNAPKARPQAGINQADLVVEEAVEGGITRLFTVFHSQDAPSVGPIRSARSSDIALAAPMNRPLFAYSGANNVFLKLVREAPMVDLGPDSGRVSGVYHREAKRPAPYNLFSSTALLYGAGGAGKPPATFFTYGTPVGKPVKGAHLEFREKVQTIVDWAWDPAAKGFRRTEDGTAHLDAGGEQVVATNVVVLTVAYHDTGIRDKSGTVVPEADLVGSGAASVLTQGTVQEGTWKKTSTDAPLQLLDGSGNPMVLTPGRTWMELGRTDANGKISINRP